MKKIQSIVSLLLFAVTLNAQQVITKANVNVRSGPTADSKVLYQIPKGTSVDLNDCQSEWCEVSVSGHKGFIAKQYTVSADEYRSIRHAKQAHPTGSVNHYTNSRGNVVQSPTHYDKRPPGATAKCRDGTYSFSQSRRGTCSHHGGVAEWLR